MQLLKLSLIVLISFNGVGCGTAGPKVKVCLSDPASSGMDCWDQNTSTSSFIDYADTENYVCLPPGDLKTVLDFCKENKGK